MPYDSTIHKIQVLLQEGPFLRTCTVQPVKKRKVETVSIRTTSTNVARPARSA